MPVFVCRFVRSRLIKTINYEAAHVYVEAANKNQVEEYFENMKTLDSDKFNTFMEDSDWEEYDVEVEHSCIWGKEKLSSVEEYISKQTIKKEDLDLSLPIELTLGDY